MINFDIKQFLRTRWLILILSAGLLTTFIIIEKQKNKIKDLEYEISDFETNVSNLENENEELQINLDECESDKDDYQNQSSYQPSNNWDLQNNNDNLEQKDSVSDQGFEGC